MKKMMAMALVLAMAVSLVACGGNTDPVGGVESTAAQTENSGVQQGEENAEVTTEDPAETTMAEETTVEETVPETEEAVVYTLDTIPKPVLTGYTYEEFDGEAYVYLTRSGCYGDVIDYEKVLTDAGFSLEVLKEYTVEGYLSQAVSGNAEILIEFVTPPDIEEVKGEREDWGGVIVSIVIEEVKETTEAEGTTEAPLFDNSWASNAYEAQLPEPPFAWSVGEAHDPNVYLMKVKDVRYTDAKAYGEVLMNCGFDIDLWVDDTTEGGNYRVIAQNKNGYLIDYDFNAYSYDQPITGLLKISIEKAGQTTEDMPEEESDTVLTLADIPVPIFTGDFFEEDDGEVHMYICGEDIYGSVLNYEETLVNDGFQIEVQREYTADGYHSSRAYKGNAEIYIVFSPSGDITEVGGKSEDKGGIQISIYFME